MSSTSPRIERGAALLDQSAPGWDNTIDLTILDLGSSSRCIVGQVYGDYERGLDILDGDAESNPARFGFSAWGQEEWWRLTDKWVAFIQARRKRKAAA